MQIKAFACLRAGISCEENKGAWITLPIRFLPAAFEHNRNRLRRFLFLLSRFRFFLVCFFFFFCTRLAAVAAAPFNYARK